MNDLQLGRAFQLVMRTTPYIAYRAMIYGLIWLAGIAYLAILGLIGWIFGAAAFWVLLILTAVLGGVLNLGRLLGTYVLYMLRAGHVALITELVQKGEIPGGTSQTAWAKERVTGYFKEISVLAFVNLVVEGVIRAVNRRLVNVMTALPVPGLEGAGKVATRVVEFSLKYVDEAIIAHTFRTENPNVYDSARSGVLLYCESWKAILKNAVMLTLLSYAFVIAATVIFLIPFGALALLFETQAIRFAFFVMAVFLGIAMKWILWDPIACTSTILTFLHETEGKEPNPEWEERIEQVSSQFKELKQRATDKYDEYSGGAGEAPPPNPPETE
ncbi:MAG: hypothetical protein ACLFU6_11415 [Candidatus Hydrogenedentota bacterium]